MTVDVPVLRCNVQTISGRVYPKEVVKRCIEDDDMQRRVNRGLLIGSLSTTGLFLFDYDIDYDTEFMPSFRVKKWKWKGDTLIAKVSIFNTPCGKIFKEALHSGIKFSICGWGDVGSDNVVSSLSISGICPIILM